MKPWAYIIRLFCFAALFGGAVFAFNWFVDPFGYFGRIPFGPHHDYEARLFKARAVRNGTYDAVILGSSRADTIAAASTARWGLRTFNAAFLGAYPEEMLYFAERFLPDVGTVVIGVDYYMLNADCRPPIRPDFGEWSWAETAKHGFSYHATRHSALTLKRHLLGRRPIYGADGSRLMERQEAANAVATTTDYGRILAFFETGFTCDYRISEDRLAALRSLHDLLRRSGRRVVMFLQPFHPALYERVLAHGQEQVFQAWRTRMREAFPDVFDLSMGPFSAPEFFYWDDPVHYTKATGEKIIDLLLGPQATPFAGLPPP